MKRRGAVEFLCLFWLVSVLCPSCRKEIVPDRYKPDHAHAAYIHSLRMAGLAETALGRDWIAVSREVFRSAVTASLPFQEAFYADPSGVFATAYVFDVLRGQRIEVEVDHEGENRGRLFLDLFRQEEAGRDYTLIASAGEKEMRLRFEPLRDGTYLIRLQPELLRGGRFTVRIGKVPSLDFPVAGKDSRAIQSGFGEPRDGGRRDHHGVDIFAPRHTPVLAPSDAYVRRVRTSEVGGRHIWLQDERRNLNFYFAHLQTQDVQPNTRVKAGERIGTVGNTGNAKTTPPHLHFGIYARREGPIDPDPFIREMDSDYPEVSAEQGLLGGWGRAGRNHPVLRSAPSVKSAKLADVVSKTPLRIVGAAGGMYRVCLPDGREGYVSARSLQPIEVVLSVMEAGKPLAIKRAPRDRSATMAVIDAGEKFSVLGRFEDYWMVSAGMDMEGWLSVPDSASAPADNEEEGG